MAYIDGQSMLPRPVELPKDVDHGILALAVWRSEGSGGEAITNNKASVYLDQLSATPLSEKTAIVTATLESTAWKLLREQSVRYLLLARIILPGKRVSLTLLCSMILL